MTPLGEILRDEIRRGGPIPFRRFMEAALYHPRLGYYRKPADRFGRSGDFFTAEQLQPVFGTLIARRLRMLVEPSELTVVELGAGRGEMAESLAGFRYQPIELGGELPGSIRGVVFSNEFFDALPVDRVVWTDGVPRWSLVRCEQDRFVWAVGDRVDEETAEYLRRYFPNGGERRSAEVNREALRWIDRIAGALQSGYVFTIDYGYTTAESKRFPDGTLMSYRRHQASEAVLADPGERDITTHVCFSALQDRGAAAGLETVRFETLARTLLDAGEADQFAEALQGGDPQRRLQLKTLLFAMGETFRTLLQMKKAPTNSSGP